MNLHKIPKIDKAVCSAEQKIAYNIAFRVHINHGDSFQSLPTEAAKSEAKGKLIRLYMENYQQSYDYKPGRYNEDAIFVALNQGLQEYLEKPFIASNYESIGRAFPIPERMD